MNESTKVSNYMSKNLITLTPNMDIHRAVNTLLDNRISGAPVLDNRDELVGILTKKDCIKVAFSASYHKERGGSVSEFMSSNVKTVSVDANIVEVAERFLNYPYRSYPAMQDDRLVGIIARHDILRALERLW